MNEGKLFAETASGLVEVVSVSTAELARLPYDLAEGVYIVGTGSTGAAAALGVSGEIENKINIYDKTLSLDTAQLELINHTNNAAGG